MARPGRFAAMLLVPLVLLSLAAAPPATAPTTAPSAIAALSNISLDRDWRFHLGDAPGAEAPEFDDSAWRTLDVPHDWSIEHPFDRNNATGNGGGYLPGGVGWYRKTVPLPAADDGRRVYVEFDGVMANSDVYVNGKHVGHRPYGYVSLRYDITDHVRFGQANVIAVRADNSRQPASRWYTGAGIYRHARLLTTDALHLVRDGVAITTPFVKAEQATVLVTAEAVNRSSRPREVALQVDVAGPGGEPAGTAKGPVQTIAPGATVLLEAQIWVRDVKLWSVGRGSMYRAALSLRESDGTRDAFEVPFGIRELRFEPELGFLLNERGVKIKGVCLHHDGGAVGAAVPIAVWEYRLDQLRVAGVNAIRTAHNPPDPAFLDLCDRKGFLVMNELFDCWTVGKNPFDYHLYFRRWSRRDVRDTVRRDRNHPSVIIWSAGNEIHDTPRAELAKGILKELVATFHENDSSRLVTQALFRPNVSHDYTNGLADLLDVVGQNYRENELLAAATQKPTRRIIGTENQHGRTIWLALRDDPRMSGQFLWSGVDYIGESRWPNTTSGSGLLDRTGGFKTRTFERQSWWSDVPMVHATRRVAAPPPPTTDPGYEVAPPQPRQRGPQLMSDWTPANRQPHEETIEVYSNAADVELFLNDRSLGKQPLPADASPRTWKVSFEPGTLRAVASINGKEVARHELRTAEAPAALQLTVNRPSVGSKWDDIAFVEVIVVDAHGTRVPTANHRVQFQLEGPGRIVAVDNADNRSHEPFSGTERTAFNGRCVALVRGAGEGKFVIRATAEGLKRGEVSLDVLP